MDEVDGMSGGDRGGVGDLIAVRADEGLAGGKGAVVQLCKLVQTVQQHCPWRATD